MSTVLARVVVAAAVAGLALAAACVSLDQLSSETDTTPIVEAGPDVASLVDAGPSDPCVHAFAPPPPLARAQGGGRAPGA